MPLLRFVLALAAATAVHLAGQRLLPSFPQMFDPFLVVVVFYALDGRTVPAMFCGLAAGLAHDVWVVGPYGVYGFAGTLVGYSVALAVQRIVIRRKLAAAGAFAAAAWVQQLIVAVLRSSLMDATQWPSGVAWLQIAGTSAVAGALVFALRSHFVRQVESWKRSRHSKVRLD